MCDLLLQPPLCVHVSASPARSVLTVLPLRSRTHRQVAPDGKVLRLDVTQVELVGEVVVKVPHHVQKTQRDAMNHLPGGPPAAGSGPVLSPQPGDGHLVQGEDVLVPGVSSRQILHSVEVTAGAQHLGDVAAEVLQDSGGDTTWF